MSQLINQHRTPPEHIAVRLEIHSNNTIPAEKWMKLVEKKKVHALKTDKEIRRKQKNHVTRMLEVSI